MALLTDELDEATEELERTRSSRQRIGAVVAGSFRVVRHIGSGGSSHVFEAEHVRLGKRFAVKLLRPELDPNRRTAQRFRREARAIARLQSEHVVSVIDCGELDDGTPYLVMELLDGEDLRSLLNREGAIPLRRAVALIIEACRGLTVVHRAGLVHRDLKPENLFITRRSTGEDWCKVLDFGVAKMEASLSTAENAIVGTARYMAPEQLADGTAVGPATDVYALAAILYECVTGEPLISGGSVQEVMYRIMNADTVPLSQRLPSVPPAISDIVQRCLNKAPTARPGGAHELAELLLDAGPGPPPSRHQTAQATLPDREVLPAAPPRRGMASHAAAATLAALGGLSLGWFLREPRPSPPSEHALPSVRNTAPARDNVSTTGTAFASRTPIATSPPSSAPSSTNPTAIASPARSVMPPRPASSGVRPKRDLNGFDSANPYE